MYEPSDHGNVSTLHLISAYMLVGSIWILFSNQILASAIRNINTLNTLATLLDIGFVFITGGIMYRLYRRTQRDGARTFSRNQTVLEQEYDQLREKVTQQAEELLQLQGVLSRKGAGINPNSNKIAASSTATARSLHASQEVSELQNAIANREFVLEFQPIVMLSHGSRIIGFEALVRWQHPEKGRIMPNDFIPLAEETNLIVPLGEWVLEEACRQNQEWRQQFPEYANLIVSVNLSSKQFNQPGLVQQVATVLDKTGLPPACLKLEITETAIMQDAERAIAMLTKLHNMGVKLSIDDFGTGYSSLSYLYSFPVDSLKVDRSFINRIDNDGEQVELVRTVLTLAWNLGLSTIAEGIETPKQLAQLRALHCECGQGFFFSKAVSGQAASKLLSQKLEFPE